MRLVPALALATLVSVVPFALAGDSCLPSCEVISHSLAFIPPLLEVDSGSTVTWTTIDIVHTATDRESFCFHTDFNQLGDGTSSFDIVDGKLYGSSDGAGEMQECTAAQSSPDGSFLLEYECLLHPNMRAFLLVR